MDTNDILRIALIAVITACCFLPGFRVKVSGPVQITEAEETENTKTQQQLQSLEDAVDKEASNMPAHNRTPSASM